MPRSNPYYQGPPSPHFDGERFRIPGHYSAKTLRDVLRWRMKSPWDRWPEKLHIEEDLPPRRVTSGIRASFIGQATVLLQLQGLNILTDPFFSERASPVQWAGPKRVAAPGVSLANLPPIDIVLLSHNHYDHMDAPALKALHKGHEPLILTPLGNGAILKRYGHFRVKELDWHHAAHAGGLTITATPALHWSRRRARDMNHALWGAFHIESDAGPVYFAGDTGYGTGAHFRELKARFGAPRLSLLPIGAYEPRWFMRDHHMGPDEAVRAHLDLGSAASLAIHHSTVQLTGEPIDAPARELGEARAQAGLAEEDFRALPPGSHVYLA